MQTHESVNYAEQLSGAIQKDTKKKAAPALNSQLQTTQGMNVQQLQWYKAAFKGPGANHHLKEFIIITKKPGYWGKICLKLKSQLQGQQSIKFVNLPQGFPPKFPLPNWSGHMVIEERTVELMFAFFLLGK